MNQALEKTCARCGRPFQWRRKWARCWDAVRYCSERCRRRRASSTDTRLEDAIVDLLRARPAASTICPSEAARLVRPDDWRVLMQPTREAARRLEARGVIGFLQNGKRVDGRTARGPVRLGRASRFSTAPRDPR